MWVDWKDVWGVNTESVKEEEYIDYNRNGSIKASTKTNEFKIKVTYVPDQLVYIVIKKPFGKIKVIEDEVAYVSFTNVVHYTSKFSKYTFSDSAKDVFTDKEKAFEYAESLVKRKQIKYIRYADLYW